MCVKSVPVSCILIIPLLTSLVFSCPVGDLDGNCGVDLHDLRIFVEQWLKPGCETHPDDCADLDDANGVNMVDLALFAESWRREQREITLVINEFMARNNSASGIRDEHGDYDDWIELHNYGDDAVDMAGLYLTDDLNEPMKWRIPDGAPTKTTIGAHGYLVLWADGEPSQGVLHLDFSLMGSGEALGLFDADENRIDGLIFGPQELNISYGRLPDATGNWRFLDNPTPRMSNETTPYEVLISEIMYHLFSQDIQAEDLREEYIELYNYGAEAVNLSGWRFNNGIDFNLPDITLEPNEYLVVAADVSAFMARYPGITNVVGGWEGRLSNSGEEIELSDSAGTRIDRVRYADEGDWGFRELGPADRGYRGWEWGAEHDGTGRSLELINPALPNEYGHNWAASVPIGGTPGRVNSVLDSDIAPLIADVGHRPIVPGPNDAVTVTAHVIDELATGVTVRLHYRVDVSEYEGPSVYPHHDPDDYNHVTMFDDGAHGDGGADDRVYGAQIPAHEDGTIIEFYVEASDTGANTRTWPGPAMMDGTPEQVTNALYQVDDSLCPDAPWVAGSQPVYCIIMTEAERAKLRDIVANSTLEGPESQMNASFVSVDGVDTKVRYTVSVRNRGHGTRRQFPNNYRVNFVHDRPWKGVTAINLNAVYPYLQLAGGAMFQMSGIGQCEAKAVQVLTNGVNLAESGSRMYGSYVHLEVVDGDFAGNHYPDDDAGNAYKCMRLTHQADLRYEGPDPGPYRQNYFKRTNTGVDDWSDLIGLTYALSNNTPDEDYVQEVNRVLKSEQWLRFIAINVLLNNKETTLANGNGDDYYLYCGVEDPRFVLIQHDLDSVFGLGQNTGAPTEGIFPATSIPTMRRFLEHPEFVRRYYYHLRDLIRTTFSAERLGPFLDQLLGDFVPAGTIDQMKDFVAQRNAHVLSLIPSELTIGSDLQQIYGYYITDVNTATLYGTADAVETRSVLVNGQLADWAPFNGRWEISENTSAGSTTLVERGSKWRYFQGYTDLGANWYQDINDSYWSEGNAELGYGDASDGRPEATTIGYIDTNPGTPEIEKNITTYFTHRFDVNDASKYSRLSLRILRDDGAVVYLNGTEIARSNMPGGEIGYNTQASSNVYGNDPDGRDMETLYYGGGVYANDDDFTHISAGHLQNGINILAVEIHQYVPSSADISFDLELTAFEPGEGKVPLQPGINRVTVATFDGPDGTGNELERGYADIWYYDGDVSEISGTLVTDKTLDAASGPWHVTDDVIVPSGVMLTIEPGTTLFFEAGKGITVDGGRLVAVGSEYQRIRMTRLPDATSQWRGLYFVDSLTDNQLGCVDMEYGDTQGESIWIRYSQVLIDHMRWAGTQETILELYHPSLIVRNSVFPGVGADETIHGEYIEGNEYMTIERSTFGVNASGGDVLDFLGAEWPGPIVQIRDNVFLGGGDDGLDLDGTDAYIEGNVFMHFHKNTSRTTTCNAVATGEPQSGGANRTEITVVRNVFFDVDHAVLLKEDAYLTAFNNVFVGATEAAIQLNEVDGTGVSGPGKGAYLDGNIFWNNTELFKHLDEATEGVVIHRSIVPEEYISFGQGNIEADPVFVDPNGDFHLKPDSPAIGTGPCGLDMGAYVPGGAAICGEPEAITYSTGATLTVGGPAITDYRYSINSPDGPWSEELSVDMPIELTGLNDGHSYIVYVIGKNAAGIWQSEDSPTASRTWTVDTSYSKLVINEVLAHTHGADPDLVELYYDGATWLDLTDMSLTDDAANARKFIFDSSTVTSTIMNPGDYMVLYGDLNTHLADHFGFALSAEGETLYLYDKPANGGGLIDSVEFGPQINGCSIGRIGYGSVWKLNKPTLGSANIMQPLGNPDTLKINEWLADGEVLFEQDFIEIYNPHRCPVRLSGMYLTDDPVTEPDKCQIEPLSFVEAEGFVVFWADESNQPGHVDFRLSADGDMIGLFDSELNEIDKVLYRPQTTDVSQGRTPDGSETFDFFALPTPGVANPAAATVTRTSLIVIDDVWSYEQSNTNFGTVWRAADYNDSSWPSGRALLYVEGSALPAPKNTPLTLGPITYYFRRHFRLEVDPNSITRLELSTVIDDGAVFYINGYPEYRLGFDEDTVVQHGTLADRSVGNATYEGPFPISTDHLVQGDNVIAVEVHQSSATSTDIVFGLTLDAVTITTEDSYERAFDLLDSLRITEIMYHHPGGSEFDYIEVQNIGDGPLDVNGVRFMEGIIFSFPPRTLEPNEYVVVAGNLAAFRVAYPTVTNVVGPYAGNLSNGGEQIVLTLAWPLEAAIMRFGYSDAWYPTTDGRGDSLVVRNVYAHPATWNDPESWQAAPPSPGGP